MASFAINAGGLYDGSASADGRGSASAAAAATSSSSSFSCSSYSSSVDAPVMTLENGPGYVNCPPPPVASSLQCYLISPPSFVPLSPRPISASEGSSSSAFVVVSAAEAPPAPLHVGASTMPSSSAGTQEDPRTIKELLEALESNMPMGSDGDVEQSTRLSDRVDELERTILGAPVRNIAIKRRLQMLAIECGV